MSRAKSRRLSLLRGVGFIHAGRLGRTVPLLLRVTGRRLLGIGGVGSRNRLMVVPKSE